MYTVRKLFKWEGSHILTDSYSKECQQIHGHSYRMEITLSSELLNDDGMVIDFKLLKEIVNPLVEKMDYFCLFEEREDDRLDTWPGMIPFDTNPTAENMCKYFYDKISEELYSRGFPTKLKVRIHETDTEWAEYEK